MANRRITADVRDKVRLLVDALCPMLPLTSRSRSTVTFMSVFSESNVAGYLVGEDVKRKALQKGWEEVIRRHPRLPYTLIRKIVPAAIDYRRHKRAPLSREELGNLCGCLSSLGIDMTRELSAIELDESVPVVRIPPGELVRRLESHPLADEIAAEPLELFKNGHFNEAVRKAAEKFEAKVQALSGSTRIGKNLMAGTFNEAAPLVALNSLSSENEREIQEGVKLMSMGMMQAYRNVFSHGDEHQRSPEECFEMLMFLNWLFRQLPSRP